MSQIENAKLYCDFRVKINYFLHVHLINWSKKPNAAVEVFDVHSTQTKIWFVRRWCGITKLCNSRRSVNVASYGVSTILTVRPNGNFSHELSALIQGSFACGWHVSVLWQSLLLVTKLEALFTFRTVCFARKTMIMQSHSSSNSTNRQRARTAQCPTEEFTWQLFKNYIDIMSS